MRLICSSDTFTRVSFELTCSDPNRETKIPGSWPEDIRRGALNIYGSHIQLINLIVHDTGGIGAWSEGEGGEIYGCLIYHNGWRGPERGHCHAIYAQNRRGTKRLIDNVMFNQFAYGIHCYGSENAFLEGFHIEGNASFNNGSLARPGELAPAIFIGGGSCVKRLQVNNNFIYQRGLRCGYPWGVPNEDAVITGNYIVGGLNVRDFETLTVAHNTIISSDSVVSVESSVDEPIQLSNWNHNTYYRTGKEYADLHLVLGDKSLGVEFDQWRQMTGADQETTYTEGTPTGVQVFVRPNLYEAGRAQIIVYNWDEAQSVSVDLSSVLREGQPYRIVSAQNFFAAPLVEGVYDGADVALPMTAAPRAQPVGMPDYRLPVTEPQFGVFVVLP